MTLAPSLLALAPGVRVRHAKQPAWGIGVVVSVTKASAHVDVVIVFEGDGAGGGQRKLRVSDASLIVPLPADELAALEAKEAAVAKAEAKAQRRESEERRKRMKAVALAPRTRIVGGGTALIDVGGGHVMFAEPGPEAIGLRVCDAAGAVVEHIEVPDGFVPSELVSDGASIVGWRTHEWNDVLFTRRGASCATVWRAPTQMSVPRREPARGVGAVVHDRERIVLAHADGSTSHVPFALDKCSIATVRWWNHDLLVGTSSDDQETDDDYFKWACVGGDGAARFRGVGATPAPVDDDVMLVFRHEETAAFDRSGAALGTLPRRVLWPDTIADKLTPFARFDDDDVVLCGSGDVSLLRWHPRDNAAKWSTVLTDEMQSLRAPVRVGRFVAVASSEYSEVERRVVWVLDADTGAVVHELEVNGAVHALVPVGDDGLVAVSYSKRVAAWRGLSTSTPERFTLVHEDKCLNAVSPAAGVVVTVDFDSVCFFAFP